jgi:hypothetical protein
MKKLILFIFTFVSVTTYGQYRGKKDTTIKYVVDSSYVVYNLFDNKKQTTTIDTTNKNLKIKSGNYYFRRKVKSGKLN